MGFCSRVGLTSRRALVCCSVLVLAAVSATSQPAVAADTEATTQASQEQARKKSQNKRVCKKVRTTGSRIPQKICMRQKQWDDITEQSQRTAEQMRDANETGIGQ